VRGAPPATNTSPARRAQRQTLLGGAAFVVVVLLISLALVRNDAAPVTVRPPSVKGSESALEFTPVTGSVRVDGRGLLPVGRDAAGADTGAALALTIVRDPAAAAYYASPASYDAELALWTAAMEAAGARVRQASPSELATDRSAAIVIPAAPCLSPATRAAMTRAASRGQGIILTGLTGTRDAGCRDLGFALLAQLTGAARVDTVPSTDETYVTIAAGSPLALDVPPGARLELRPAPHVAVRHAGRTVYYSDRDLNPTVRSETPLLDGAVIHDLTQGRRLVYFGFELGSIVDRPWERAMTALLVRNAVALAGGVAMAGPAAWPRGHRAAAVIAQDVEDEFDNAKHALDTLSAVGAPGTFYLVSDLAEQHPALVRRMAAAGEIGTHTENHATLGGSIDIQHARLDRTRAQLTTLTNRPVAGLRPPEEQFDAQTLIAWRRVGGQYIFGANDGRSASPELVEVEGAPFVLIGRVVDDDFITVRRARITEPARLAADQLAAYEKVHALGGLFVMSYHSNMLARPATVPALGIIARRLRADTTTWLTTAADVASWWSSRHHLATSVIRTSPSKLEIVAENRGTGAIAPFVLLVTLPTGERMVSSPQAPMLPPENDVARLLIPGLAAGTVFKATILLERRDAR
jgi:peptidoglycan/xylan/chitin deacetylase (PgdA/CDA1 family)